MVHLMAQRLKSWESPRRQGRNIKGKGGSARAKQLKKQQQLLRKKLKQQDSTGKGNSKPFPLFFTASFPASINTSINGVDGGYFPSVQATGLETFETADNIPQQFQIPLE